MPLCLVQILKAARLTERSAKSAAMPLPRLQLTFPLQVYHILALNQVHHLNHQARWRSPLETSAKDSCLWLKHVLYHIICWFDRWF